MDCPFRVDDPIVVVVPGRVTHKRSGVVLMVVEPGRVVLVDDSKLGKIVFRYCDRRRNWVRLGMPFMWLTVDHHISEPGLRPDLQRKLFD